LTIALETSPMRSAMLSCDDTRAICRSMPIVPSATIRPRVAARPPNELQERALADVIAAYDAGTLRLECQRRPERTARASGVDQLMFASEMNESTVVASLTAIIEDAAVRTMLQTPLGSIARTNGRFRERKSQQRPLPATRQGSLTSRLSRPPKS
jgi:hypothetical protein